MKENPGNFCLWNPDSWVLESENTAQGIRNPRNDWNPESKFQLTNTEIQYLKFGTQNVESRIHDCPGSPYLERDKGHY